MELILRKAEEKDLDGLDQVMLVISDKAGDRETVKQLLKKIDNDPQKYLLVAEDKETGTICGSLLGVVFEDICDDFCRPISPGGECGGAGKLPGQGRGPENV